MTNQLSRKSLGTTGRVLRTLAAGIACTVLLSSSSTANAGDQDTKPKTDSTATFRELALQLFDTDHNGRLDSREQAAATRALLARHVTEPKRQLLRQKALEEFDANDNGKLERQEIRAALRSVNRSATASESTALAKSSGDSDLAKSVERQIMRLGKMDDQSAHAFALANFDFDGDGVLNHSELTAASEALQQYAEVQAARQLLAQSTQLSVSLPAGTTTTGTTTTGTGTTGTTSSGTGTTSSSSSSMCSGSSTSSGTSSTTGTTTSSNAARTSTTSTNTLTPFGAQSGGLGNGFGGGFAPRFGGGFGGFRGR